MDELRTTAAADGRLLLRSESERLLDLRIVPWDVLANTGDSGPERFVRGAFADADPATVTLEAIGPHGPEAGVRLAGRAVSLEDREDGEYGTFRVSRTVAGDELLELARDGVYRDASVVFSPVDSRRASDGAIERVRAVMRRVGIVERGSYPGAAVLAARSNGGTSMTEPTPDPTPDPPAPTPDPEPHGTVLARTDAIDELRADMLGRMTALEARGAVRPAGPMARFSSFADYLSRAVDDRDTAVLLARALVDQVTTDNPGVMPPSYLSTVFGIIAQSREGISAFGGGQSLGSSGMALHWPYFDGTLVGLVAKQATEKADIASVKVSIKDGTTPIETFAGGSDVSYQLIRRSSPAYLEAYGRIMMAGWALTTESTFEAALLAHAAGTFVLDPATAAADDVRAALFEASSKVKSATGSPASIVLASSDAFIAIGSLPGLWPTTYGTVNAAGTAQASTLAVNVSGLPIIEAPYLPAGTIIVSNPSAAGWHEDGPFIATAEDVAKLGQNRAVWSMGATAAYLPAGIVKNTLVTRSASSSK